MRGFLLRRLVAMLPVLLGVVTVVFLALRLIPGDPAIALAGEKASAAQIEQMREALGLNRPLPVQYVEFLGRLARGDMARSSMLEVLGSEYLVTARAKGLRDRAVVLVHALRNALIPVVTVVGLQLGALLSG